jgi:hypothetical protein
MAARKLTFTLPESLAEHFLRRVPARDRSRYVADAIATKLRERENLLIRSCEVANANPDVLGIEQEWDAIENADRIQEPWQSAPPR